jgi:branched-chain amino acid transport system substrate-binding protein
MIKHSALLAAVVWCASSLSLATSATAQSDPAWLMVEVAPLSGPASTVGTRLNRSAKMWADEINNRGGIKGRKIRLVTCNDEGRPEKAVSCARDAVRDGATLVFGHSLTASLRAMQPVLANGPVMIIASPNIVPSADSLAFQTSPSDEHITEAIAHFLKQNGINKLGMIAATDASGEVGVVSARKVFAEQKIELQVARVDLRATDATTQIAAVAGADIKVVYSSYSGAGAATVVKSFVNLDLKQPLIVSYANLSQAFIDVVKGFMPPRLLGTSVRALVPASLSDPVLRDRAVKFMDAYRKAYNEPADMINILGKFDADVAQAILENVANPSDGRAVKTFLEGTVIESLHRIKFSPQSHVGLGADDVIIAEFKGDEWISAAPVR